MILEATIPQEQMYDWDGQAAQFPPRGPEGIMVVQVMDGPRPINCVLYRGAKGALLGILYHYPVDCPPWEKAGNVNIWVHPDHQRQGIGTKLARKAMAKWNIDPEQQRYSPSGLALAKKLVES